LNKDRGRESVGEMKRVADDLSRTAPMAGKVDIIGPAESPIARIKGRNRWQLLLKGEDSRALHELTRAILDRSWPGGLDIKVDVDPLNFM
jgi:primosomal protein N' (replication factor Y)